MAGKKGKTKQTDSKKRVAEITEQLEHAFLAGLGAFSNAQKAGEKTFDKLVKQGEDFRKKTSKKTESLIDDVQDAIRDMTGDAQSRAEGLLDQVRDKSNISKLPSVFDARVADAMERLKVPTKKDVDAINRKLSKILKLLEEKPAKASVPAVKKTTKKVAKKTAAKKTAAKKTVARKTTSKPAAAAKPEEKAA